MYELLPVTELLYSSWIISDEEGTPLQTLPTAKGVLDYALRDAISQGAFPAWAKDQLHFVDGKTGLRCLELRRIQQLATQAKLTKDPNPSYTQSDVVVGKPVARRCLARLGISEEEAAKWGRSLRQAVAAWEGRVLEPEPA